MSYRFESTFLAGNYGEQLPIDPFSPNAILLTPVASAVLSKYVEMRVPMRKSVKVVLNVIYRRLFVPSRPRIPRKLID